MSSKSSKKQSVMSVGNFYKKPSAQLNINEIFGDILVYFRMMALIMGAAGTKGFGLLVVWIFYAPFWLLFKLYIDIKEFIKILLNT